VKLRPTPLVGVCLHSPGFPDNLAEVRFDDLNKGTEPKKHPIFFITSWRCKYISECWVNSTGGQEKSMV